MDKLNREAREVYLYAAKELNKITESCLYHANRTIGDIGAPTFRSTVVVNLVGLICDVSQFKTKSEKRALKRMPRRAKPKKKAKRR